MKINLKIECVHLLDDEVVSPDDIEMIEMNIHQVDFEHFTASCPKCGKEISFEWDVEQ